MAGYRFALEPDFNLVSYIKRERKNHNNLLQEQEIVLRIVGQAQMEIMAGNGDGQHWMCVWFCGCAGG
jgi:hypothetical protein